MLCNETTRRWGFVGQRCMSCCLPASWRGRVLVLGSLSAATLLHPIMRGIPTTIPTDTMPTPCASHACLQPCPLSALPSCRSSPLPPTPALCAAPPSSQSTTLVRLLCRWLPGGVVGPPVLPLGMSRPAGLAFLAAPAAVARRPAICTALPRAAAACWSLPPRTCECCFGFCLVRRLPGHCGGWPAAAGKVVIADDLWGCGPWATCGAACPGGAAPHRCTASCPE